MTTIPQLLVAIGKRIAGPIDDWITVPDDSVFIARWLEEGMDINTIVDRFIAYYDSDLPDVSFDDWWEAQ